MRKIQSGYLIVIGVVIVSFLSIIVVQQSSNRVDNDDFVYTPTTTARLAASFKEDEIKKIGELKYEGSYVGDIYARYVDEKRNISSEIIVSRNVAGKNLISYRLAHEGSFQYAERDIIFDEKEFGGFLGYATPLVGNDFFVVQYLGMGLKKVSGPLIVYWDPGNKQFQATSTIPKIVSDILAGKEEPSQVPLK